MKAVVLHNIISPHNLPLFAELSKKFDLTVLFCAEREENRDWNARPEGFKYKVLPGLSLKLKGKDLFTYFINPTIAYELFKLKPDIVITSGWDLFAYQIAFFYCKFFRIKFLVWSGSTENESSWRRSMSKPLVKLMVKKSDALIAYGTKAKQYLVSLGVPSSRIYISYNTTDILKYQKLCTSYRVSKKAIKSDLGLSRDRVITYYGQLIERKGVDTLVEAFSEVYETFNHVKLLIIGSGDFRDYLVNVVNRKKIRNIVFIDNPGDEEICKYYAISDLFVLPSREEVWGLVVNEAMACGLPVIVSDSCGSSADLVKNGINGYTFKAGMVKDLSQKINKIIGNSVVIKKMGENSSSIISTFGPEKTVNGINKAIRSTF